MASPRKFLVLAKIETTQFTDATPVAASNSILVKNLKCTPLRVESADRALIRPYFGNSEMLPVMEEALIEFDVEVAGAGAAGTAPKYGPLLRGSSFGETINAGVSVVYNPVSASFEFLTIYAYRDGVLYKLLGAHGSVSLDMGAKKIPHFHFKFVGKYSAVTDAAIPGGADFSGFQVPKASIPANLGTTTIGGYAAKLSAFTVDMANEVSHAVWMNNETLSPVDRKPKGTLTVEAVTVATKDYFTTVRNATLSALTLAQGTVAGNIVQFDAPKVQLVDHAEGDFSGALSYTFNTTLNPNAGNDEFVITVK